MTRTKGAAQFSTFRSRSMPRKMMKMFRPQKIRNDSHSEPVWPSRPGPSSVDHPGIVLTNRVLSASPPIQAWIPNQPQATSARISAGRFDPIVPYAARAKTGNGIPYFVPGCELRRMGARTMVLPSSTVRSACHQLMPSAMRPEASM
jgi:hypothetical protein